MKPLTEKQAVVLEFLQAFARQCGFPPTMREIGQGVGLTYVSAVRGHLAALEKKGYIARESDKARSIRVLRSPSVLSRVKRKLHEVTQSDRGVLHRVVYGIAIVTRRRQPVFEGRLKKLMLGELDKRSVEHGWRFIAKNVESDHVSVIVEVWPNHSPERVARRIRTAGVAAAKLCRRRRSPGRIWAEGYAVTTEPDRLDELLMLAFEQADAEGQSSTSVPDSERM